MVFPDKKPGSGGNKVAGADGGARRPPLRSATLRQTQASKARAAAVSGIERPTGRPFKNFAAVSRQDATLRKTYASLNKFGGGDLVPSERHRLSANAEVLTLEVLKRHYEGVEGEARATRKRSRSEADALDEEGTDDAMDGSDAGSERTSLSDEVTQVEWAAYDHQDSARVHGEGLRALKRVVQKAWLGDVREDFHDKLVEKADDATLSTKAAEHGGGGRGGCRARRDGGRGEAFA